MANSQLHIIDQLKVELSVHNPEQANRLQEEISSIIHHQLEENIEKLFDSVPAHKTIVIDCLELDLGILSEENFGEWFLEKTCNTLDQKLSKLIEQANPTSNEKRELSSDELFFETFIQYLHTGTYPWFVSQDASDSDLRKPIELYNFLMSEQKQKLLSVIKEEVAYAGFRKRLVYLLDDKRVNDLLKDLKPTGMSPDLESLQVIMRDAGLDRDKSSNVLNELRLALSTGVTSTQILWDILVESISETGSSEQFFNRLAKKSHQVNHLNDGVFISSLKELTGLYRLKQLLSEGVFTSSHLRDNLKQIPEAAELKQFKDRIKNEKLNSADITEMMSEINISIKEKLGREVPRVIKESNQKAKYSVHEDFYVTNAGLILLWPFLPQFFRALELTAEKQFIDTGSQCRAIHILQYLVSGKKINFEYVMVLNKILCGYKLSNPFPSSVQLSNNDILQADAFLQMVIHKWKGLKSTSPAGFRKSFLQRNAKFKKQPDHWLLQVETTAFDLLLDKLPWGISVVKLPWMKKPIYTNWR